MSGLRRFGGGIAAIISVLFAALLLVGCTAKSDGIEVSALWSEQLSTLPGVRDFDARYVINPGMGSTARIRVTATGGTDSHALLVEVLRVAASAGTKVNSSTSMSFSVAASDDGPYLNALDAGLEQNPSMRDVMAFVDALP